jgi:hypothetical protein
MMDGGGEGVKTTEKKLVPTLFLILFRMLKNRQKQISEYNLKRKSSVLFPSHGATTSSFLDKYWNQLGIRVGAWGKKKGAKCSTFQLRQTKRSNIPRRSSLLHGFILVRKVQFLYLEQ